MRANIYVAAPSCDLDRYRAFVARLRDRGIEVTHDWSEAIMEAKRQGLDDRSITEEFAASAALADAVGVRDCSVLVLLAPLANQVTIGAWVELGIAIGMRTARRRPFIVVSDLGRARQYAIFEELADVRVDSDEEAIAAAVRLTRSMELDDIVPEQFDIAQLEAAP